MKKIMLLILFLSFLGCTSRETINNMNYNKERVNNVEKYLWENQIKTDK